MRTTRHFGLTAVRTASQVSKSISIREATGKRRIAASGRAVRTYFDLALTLKCPEKTDSSVDRYPKGRLAPPHTPPPSSSCTAASLQ